VVLNLVDSGDHGGIGEELLEIPLAVLFHGKRFLNVRQVLESKRS
jgi:hypothetical protein